MKTHIYHIAVISVENLLGNKYFKDLFGLKFIGKHEYIPFQQIPSILTHHPRRWLIFTGSLIEFDIRGLSEVKNTTLVYFSERKQRKEDKS